MYSPFEERTPNVVTSDGKDNAVNPPADGEPVNPIGGPMNTPSGIPSAANRSKLAAGILKRGGTVIVFLVLIAAVLFVAAGRMDWVWAWVYIGISLACLAVNGTIMVRTNPEIAAERTRSGETKDWDKAVGGLWGAAIYIALPLVAGLDVRFGWTRDPGPAWHIAGAVLLAAGYGCTAWAMVVNAFFSTAVRIQRDRGHTVCSSGPYRFIRHPGYAGFILQSLGVPFLLSSWWSLIPGVLAAVLMILRTVLEDRTLQTELPGYPEYARKVRSRLVPGVW
jgi:protein-S-isoprenylcysteine O-methyltransferase Ste14